MKFKLTDIRKTPVSHSMSFKRWPVAYLERYKLFDGDTDSRGQSVWYMRNTLTLCWLYWEWEVKFDT